MKALISTGRLAIISKASSVDAGYYEDKYINEFVATGKQSKRNPLVNRIYFCRVWVIRFAVRKFFESLRGVQIQIVNLGGGLDSLYYYVRDSFENFVYFDIDFPELLAEKSQVIRNKSALAVRNCIDQPDGLVASDDYKMVPADLNLISQLEEQLLLAGFDKNKPTLFIAECVLCYLQPEQADKVIRFCNEFTSNSTCMVVFEQIEPNDPFGKKLVDSFNKWGCPVYIDRYPSINDHKRRYLNLGWNRHFIYTLRDVYEYIIDESDKKRIEMIEIFDELEEWMLVVSHYLFSFALNEVDYPLDCLSEALKFERRQNPSFTTEEIIKLIKEKKICSKLGAKAYIRD